jgi:hypothetical protein
LHYEGVLLAEMAGTLGTFAGDVSSANRTGKPDIVAAQLRAFFAR